jgi:nucleotide-binding universal stress UspA family protein
MSTKKILVPTDLSASTAPARELAVALAKRYGAEVLLFHAVLTHANDLRQFGALLSDLLDRLEAEANRRLEEETSRLRERGLVVHHEVVQASSAFDAILERTKTWAPDLIVMATHARTGMPRWFLGSVAEKVVRHVPCSVATIRPEGEEPWKGEALERILVPVDFSDNAKRAVALARELVSEKGTLIVHHVVHNPTLAGLASTERLRLFSAEPTLVDKIRAEMEEWLAGEPFEPAITEADDVATSILEVAADENADLIVAGVRGQSGFEHFLAGSVADKLVRISPLPVITVR